VPCDLIHNNYYSRCGYYNTRLIMYKYKKSYKYDRHNKSYSSQVAVTITKYISETYNRGLRGTLCGKLFDRAWCSPLASEVFPPPADAKSQMYTSRRLFRDSNDIGVSFFQTV